MLICNMTQNCLLQFVNTKAIAASMKFFNFLSFFSFSPNHVWSTLSENISCQTFNYIKTKINAPIHILKENKGKLNENIKVSNLARLLKIVCLLLPRYKVFLVKLLRFPQVHLRNKLWQPNIDWVKFIEWYYF